MDLSKFLSWHFIHGVPLLLLSHLSKLVRMCSSLSCQMAAEDFQVYVDVSV